MPAWELVDHPADVGLAAYGRDAAEALAHAGAGLFDTMLDLAAVREVVARELTVAAADPADLLVAWLNELLYVFEVEGLAFRRFEVEVADEGRRLRATGCGEPFDPARHAVKLGVKAATHHQAAFEPTAGPPDRRWRAYVILDV